MTVNLTKFLASAQPLAEEMLGAKLGFHLKNHEYRNGDYCAIFDIEQDFGVFNSIIKEANVYIILGSYDVQDEEDGPMRRVITARVELAYQHHGGGSNGHTVGRIWLDDQYNITDSITEKQRDEEREK